MAIVIPHADDIRKRVLSERVLRTGYAKLVAATWTDDGVTKELLANPAAVLNRYGIETQPGAKISVEVVDPTGEGSFQSQIASLILGHKTGTYTLWLPKKPEGIMPRAADVGTTCTPCCCCT